MFLLLIVVASASNVVVAVVVFVAIVTSAVVPASLDLESAITQRRVNLCVCNGFTCTYKRLYAYALWSAFGDSCTTTVGFDLAMAHRLQAFKVPLK